MADAGYTTREIRYIFHDHSVEVYVRIDADGDCPIGVQGWHYKHFVDGVQEEDRVKDAPPTDGRWSIMNIGTARSVLWPQKAPSER